MYRHRRHCHGCLRKPKAQRTEHREMQPCRGHPVVPSSENGRSTFCRNKENEAVFKNWSIVDLGFPGRASDKEHACQVFLPGESHGQRTLAGTIHRVAESWIRLKWLSTHAHIVDTQRCVSFRRTASNSVIYLYYIYIYIYILFQIPPCCRLLQGIEYSFLCYTVGLLFTILYSVHLLIQNS